MTGIEVHILKTPRDFLFYPRERCYDGYVTVFSEDVEKCRCISKKKGLCWTTKHSLSIHL